jgi:hypothetical protein
MVLALCASLRAIIQFTKLHGSLLFMQLGMAGCLAASSKLSASPANSSSSNKNSNHLSSSSSQLHVQQEQ